VNQNVSCGCLGLFHALLDIRNINDLLGYPEMDASWEGFLIEQILLSLPDWRASFYQDVAKSEIDLILQKGRTTIAIECKASSAPKVARGFWTALEVVKADEAWILAPVKDDYPYKKNVRIASPTSLLTNLSVRGGGEVKN